MTELTLPIIVVCSEGSKNPQEIIDSKYKIIIHFLLNLLVVSL